MPVLLTRDAFREGVFARDRHACVMCGRTDTPLDAHHIMERRLWPDGGYYLDNGATVCELHHRAAEATGITPYELWERIGAKPLLPPHLPPDGVYDKWGNEQVGERWLPGELFHDESVQKVLSAKLPQFTHHRKYPKTPHLPWSNPHYDDFTVSEDIFAGKQIVITEKMDGENTTMYHDYVHARSLDMSYHQSRTWVKNLHAKIAHEIPEDWRICGENLFAKHAIAYYDLPSFFLVFSIWAGDTCLSWDDTVDYCDVLGLDTVRVLWRGPWGKIGPTLAREPGNYFSRFQSSDEMEGYVVRSADAFTVKNFRHNMAKYVRPNHVNESTQNWKAKPVVPNELVR